MEFKNEDYFLEYARLSAWKASPNGQRIIFRGKAHYKVVSGAEKTAVAPASKKRKTDTGSCVIDNDVEDDDTDGDESAGEKRRGKSKTGCANPRRSKIVKVSMLVAGAPTLCPFAILFFVPAEKMDYNGTISDKNIRLACARMEVPASDLGGAAWTYMKRVSLIWKDREWARIVEHKGEELVRAMACISDAQKFSNASVRTATQLIFGDAMRPKSFMDLLPICGRERLQTMSECDIDTVKLVVEKSPMSMLLPLSHFVPYDRARYLTYPGDPSKLLIESLPPFAIPVQKCNLLTPKICIAAGKASAEFAKNSAATVSISTNIDADESVSHRFSRALLVTEDMEPPAKKTPTLDAKVAFAFWEYVVKRCRTIGATTFTLDDLTTGLDKHGADTQILLLFFLVGARRIACIGPNKFALADAWAPLMDILDILRTNTFAVNLVLGENTEVEIKQGEWCKEVVSRIPRRHEFIILCPGPHRQRICAQKGDMAMTLDDYVDSCIEIEEKSPKTFYVLDNCHTMNIHTIVRFLRKLQQVPAHPAHLRGIIMYGSRGVGGMCSGSRGALNLFEALIHLSFPNKQMTVGYRDPEITSLATANPLTGRPIKWNDKSIMFAEYFDDTNVLMKPGSGRAHLVLTPTAQETIRNVVKARVAADVNTALLTSTASEAQLLNSGTPGEAGLFAQGDPTVNYYGEVLRIDSMSVTLPRGGVRSVESLKISEMTSSGAQYHTPAFPAPSTFADCPLVPLQFQPVDDSGFSVCNTVIYVTSAPVLLQSHFKYALSLAQKTLVIFLPRNAMSSDFAPHVDRPPATA